MTNGKPSVTDRQAELLEELYQLRDAVEKKDREIAKLQAELGETSGKLETAARTARNLALTVDVATANQEFGGDPRLVPDLVGRALRDHKWTEDHNGIMRVENDKGLTTWNASEWLRNEGPKIPWYKSNLETQERQAGGTTVPHNAAQAAQAGTRETGLTDAELEAIFDRKSGKFNLTKACEIETQNPELAARIAARVGNNIFKPATSSRDARFRK
jgi:hypothetical protein